MSDTETYSMSGIPDDKVEQFVKILKMDSRYVSHTVTPDGNGTNTITVTNKKVADTPEGGANP